MLLTMQNVKKAFTAGEKSIPVLRGVDLELDQGQTLALTGESGSGKSTLLHLAGGLDTANTGRILINAQDLTKMDDAGRASLRRGVVGVIFQQFNLIPSLTVAANIAFQARLSGMLDQPFVDHLTETLGLSQQLSKYPEALSGGQQQRVAIARTLAAKPRLVLADEPTGNLDEATADAVLHQMLTLADDTGAALMVVTHSHAIAQRMERQAHLKGGLLA